MPTASRRVRKIRRIKRDRSIAYRMASMLFKERGDARMVAHGLEQELQKYITKYGELAPDAPPVPEGSVEKALRESKESANE